MPKPSRKPKEKTVIAWAIMNYKGIAQDDFGMSVYLNKKDALFWMKGWSKSSKSKYRIVKVHITYRP